MNLSKYLVKSFIKKSVKKTAQAASWLPAINLKLVSMAYLAGYKVTNSGVLQSTGFTANELSLLFKRYAEDRGPHPKAKVNEMVQWFMADVAFGMEADTRKLSIFFNRFSTLFEEFSNQAGKEARILADAYWYDMEAKQREEMEDFEEVSLEDIETQVNVFDIQMNRKSPR